MAFQVRKPEKKQNKTKLLIFQVQVKVLPLEFKYGFK